MSDRISPYSWPEILDRFPLSSRRVKSVPEGRKIRAVGDLAAQYGDILQYGNSYVGGWVATATGGTSVMVMSTASWGSASFTVSGTTTASSWT